MTSKAHFSIHTNCAGDWRCHETLKRVVVFLLFLFVRKKTGRKNKNYSVFSVKTLNFLVGFYQPPTVISISVKDG